MRYLFLLLSAYFVFLKKQMIAVDRCRASSLYWLSFRFLIEHTFYIWFVFEGPKFICY